MKLIMLKGLPASGKSTVAEKIIKEGGEFFRVNRDLLRKMLHCDVWSGKREGTTIFAQQLLVAQLLSEGKNVIVDDTNLGDKHVEMWKMMAENYGAKFEIIDMMKEVDYEECVKRNNERENGVPSGVIENMALQYGLTPHKRFIVCDIDGTIADVTHRLKHVKGDKKDWKAFFAEMNEDTPRHDVWDKVKKLSRDEDVHIILVSARPEDYREVTEQWLRDNNMDDAISLIMRRKGDKRPDTDVKGDIYQRYLAQYDIVKVFDDRPSVIRMWEENGLEVEDCGNGKEF